VLCDLLCFLVSNTIIVCGFLVKTSSLLTVTSTSEPPSESAVAEEGSEKPERESERARKIACRALPDLCQHFPDVAVYKSSVQRSLQVSHVLASRRIRNAARQLRSWVIHPFDKLAVAVAVVP